MVPVDTAYSQGYLFALWTIFPSSIELIGYEEKPSKDALSTFISSNKTYLEDTRKKYNIDKINISRTKISLVDRGDIYLVEIKQYDKR